MSNLPSGTVTFLFTDIEGSTQLWEQHPEAMKAALARHDALLREAMAAHHGQIIKTTGDGLHAVFASVIDAVAAVVSAQGQLQAPIADLRLRVRMGLHTGEAEQRDGDYYGTTLNRAARVMGLAHGGQILLSAATAELVRNQLTEGQALKELGQHQLKGVARPESIYQLCAPNLRADFPALTGLAVPSHNLPLQLTSFIGREKEMADVKGLLASARLVTLTGPGGTGKTRLSIEVGGEALADFPNGVWLVELAPLTDPAHIVSTLAALLGLRELPSRSLESLVLDYMREKSLLIILDNCEHLIEACAQLSQTLLQTCPHLKILASSREGLGLAGEMTYRIPPLLIDEHNLLASEALRLFLDRATAAQPRFKLDDRNAASVAQICTRLDGIPLAIELAAVRVKLFSVEQIAERLSDRFRLLVGGSRAALPRQQTLRALIDWSYDLLSDDERKLWRCLCVFAGGWTFEAAEAIAPELDVLELLTHLVDKSLVMSEADSESGEVRYRFLETIRQYGREKLFEAQEASAARDRHFYFFVDFARQAWDAFRGPDMIRWRETHNPENDNLRAALDWGQANHPEDTLDLISNISLGWSFDGIGTEARHWLMLCHEKVMALPPVSGTALLQRQRRLAKGLYAEGTIAIGLGDSRRAYEVLTEAIILARLADDKITLAYSLGNWALAAYFLNLITDSEQAAREALELSQALGDKFAQGMALMVLSRLYMVIGEPDKREANIAQARQFLRDSQIPFITSMTIMGLGIDAMLRGNFEVARQYFTDALAFFQQQKNKHFSTVVLSELAHIARWAGDIDEAVETYRRTLIAWQDLGQRAAIAHQLECLAFIAIAQKQLERAANLLGAAEALRAVLGAPMLHHERLEYERYLAELHTRLDENTCAARWAGGSALTMEQAIQFALDLPHV